MRETMCIFFAVSHWLKYRGRRDHCGWVRYKRLVGAWGICPIIHDTLITLLHAVGIHRNYEWCNDSQCAKGRWKLGKPVLTFMYIQDALGERIAELMNQDAAKEAAE